MDGDFEQGAIAGTPVTADWATVTDPLPGLQASGLTVTIDWGDKTTSAGTVTGSNGEFIISGSHTYAAKGSDTVTITVTDPNGTTTTATSTAQVGDVEAGIPATLTVASFPLVNPTDTASDYTATVVWGDGTGTDTTATVTLVNGMLVVQGKHTYAVDSLDLPGGVYQVSVSLNGPGGSVQGGNTTVNVERPEETGLGEDVTAQAGVQFRR